MNKSKHYIATFHNDHHKFVDVVITGKPEIIEYVADDKVYRIGDEYLYSFEDFKDCREIVYSGVVVLSTDLFTEGQYLWGKVDFSGDTWEPVEMIVSKSTGDCQFLRCGIASVYSAWRLEVCGQDIMVEDTKSK